MLGSQVDIGAYERAPLGDFNLDGVMNGLDIPGFKSALADVDAWSAACNVDGNLVGDFNGDGVLNGLDIPGFKTALAGGVVAAGAPLAPAPSGTGPETTPDRVAGDSWTAVSASTLTAASRAGAPHSAIASGLATDDIAAWLELQRLRRTRSRGFRFDFESSHPAVLQNET